MKNALIILRKEWLEMRQQPILLLGIVALPMLFTAIPLVLLAVMSRLETTNLNGFNSTSLAFPQFADLNPQEMAQVALAMVISNLYLILPGIVTSIIASYSIVGEKVSRTLEPLLATPVRTWELLMGKCLASLLPGIIVTWSGALVFIAGVALFGASPRVLPAVVNPGWLVLLLIWAPLLAIIAIAVMIGISSRANEPRTAQQASVWLVVPLLGMIFSQIGGLQVLGLTFTLGIALVLALLAGLALWIATVIFSRENILTRWK
jgi:ABC-2 type transport system permease protein